VHQFALKTWFFQDDFAWLGLRLGVNSSSDLLRAMFSPKAEGTVRTLSERVYFLIFPALFGLNVAPFKVWTFLTELANIALLSQIARRLTGSPLAGFLAAILWTANAGERKYWVWQWIVFLLGFGVRRSCSLPRTSRSSPRRPILITKRTSEVH